MDNGWSRSLGEENIVEQEISELNGIESEGRLVSLLGTSLLHLRLHLIDSDFDLLESKEIPCAIGRGKKLKSATAQELKGCGGCAGDYC